MAYPGENEHKEYLDYSMRESEEGRKPMSKDEWRKAKKEANDREDTELEDAKKERHLQ